MYQPIRSKFSLHSTTVYAFFYICFVCRAILWHEAPPHGIAVIINNKKFEPSTSNPSLKLDKRAATDTDEKNLSRTFRFLGYNVEMYREPKAEEMLKIFEKITSVRSAELANHDSFVCCILSHGKEGKIIASLWIWTTLLQCSKLQKPTRKAKNVFHSGLPGKGRGSNKKKIVVLQLVWSQIQSRKFHQRLISSSALLLHQATLHIALLTRMIRRVLLTSRHFAKLSAIMQSTQNC